MIYSGDITIYFIQLKLDFQHKTETNCKKSYKYIL